MQKQTNSKTPHKHITTSTKLIPSQLVRSQVRTAHQQSRAFLRYLTRRWSHLRMTNPAVRPYRAQPAQQECANKPSLKQHVPFRKAELSTYMASTLTPAPGHPTSQESPYHHPKAPHAKNWQEAQEARAEPQTHRNIGVFQRAFSQGRQPQQQMCREMAPTGNRFSPTQSWCRNAPGNHGAWHLQDNWPTLRDLQARTANMEPRLLHRSGHYDSQNQTEPQNQSPQHLW